MTSRMNILRTNKLPFGLQECADSLKGAMPILRPLKINACRKKKINVCRLWCFIYSLIHGTVPAVLKFLSRRHSSKGPFAEYGQGMTFLLVFSVPFKRLPAGLTRGMG